MTRTVWYYAELFRNGPAILLSTPVYWVGAQCALFWITFLVVCPFKITKAEKRWVWQVFPFPSKIEFQVKNCKDWFGLTHFSKKFIWIKLIFSQMTRLLSIPFNFKKWSKKHLKFSSHFKVPSTKLLALLFKVLKYQITFKTAYRKEKFLLSLIKAIFQLSY